jgi:hypothetical protein
LLFASGELTWMRVCATFETDSLEELGRSTVS